MSGGTACECEGTRKERMKNWVVKHLLHNHSYFGPGPRGSYHPSDYSEVWCKKCNKRWRTKAKYVFSLPYEDPDIYPNEQEEEK